MGQCMFGGSYAPNANQQSPREARKFTKLARDAQGDGRVGVCDDLMGVGLVAHTLEWTYLRMVTASDTVTLGASWVNWRKCPCCDPHRSRSRVHPHPPPPTHPVVRAAHTVIMCPWCMFQIGMHVFPARLHPNNPKATKPTVVPMHASDQSALPTVGPKLQGRNP